MHEASIAISLLEKIESYERQHKVRVEKVVLEVGAGCGVNIESLSFCLKALKEQQNLSVAFRFVEKKMVAHCNNCGGEIELDFPTYLCPVCKDIALNIIDGMDFNILEFEVSDES